MNQLEDLKPELLWKYFYNLTRIPRPSRNEQKVRNYIKEVARLLGLRCKEDKTGNILVIKPAYQGYENRKTVILQAHMDMVPQKNEDVKHDFDKDPIIPLIDGDWVRAENTTLGADNGIGLAAILAILEDSNLAHGPIEALFTVDEETGMTGAFGIEEGFLEGDILMNLDSEDDEDLIIGCAGGMDINLNWHYSTNTSDKSLVPYMLSLKGLKGGHSGMDIHLGRGNANKILARVISNLYDNFPLMQLVSFEGGNMRNAIPREASAMLLLEPDMGQQALKVFESIRDKIAAELKLKDPGINLKFTPLNEPFNGKKAVSQNSLIKIINLIYALPNGVLRMSDDMEGVVETSSNLAIVKVLDGKAEISILLRSMSETAKVDAEKTFRSISELADVNLMSSGGYPGWQPNIHSQVLNLMMGIYHEKHGKAPVVQAIHAGLECGILIDKYPWMDMISFGPTIRHPHSPDERVNIKSVEKFWNLLISTLEQIPGKY